MELGEELPDAVCLLGTSELQEAVISSSGRLASRVFPAAVV